MTSTDLPRSTSPRWPTIPDALDHLAELGNAEDIAIYLAGRGHIGQSATDCCPVAIYLHAETGSAVEVDPYSVTDGDWQGETWEVDDPLCSCPLPRPVRDFALRFDIGDFPGLLADDAPRTEAS